jgi:gamma-glutamylcyclotransferase (GGCT)/AIG2-like uncharacterized protein YtfP
MKTNELVTEKLFSYGSLRDEGVQRAIFGRRLDGAPDAVIGYRLTSVKITEQKSIKISGKEVHQIIEPAKHGADQVEGMVFDITGNELVLADQYEDAAYKRVQATLRSGSKAWVYVRAAGGAG